MTRAAAAVIARGAPLVAAVLLGVAGAVQPQVAVVAMLAILFAGLCVAAYRRPERLLAIAPFLVLLASTKFRRRDPTASLSGQVDAQILFELGLYAAVAAIVCFAGLARRARLRVPDATPGALVAYVGVVLASAAWSLAPVVTVVRAGQLAVLLALVVGMVQLLGARPTLDALASSVVTYVVLASGVSLALYGSAGLMDGRFRWFDVHPIECGTDAATAVLFVVAAFLFPRLDVLRWPTPARWASGLACAGVLVLTLSRGPLVACAAAVATLVGIRYVRATLVPVATAAVLMAAVVYANAATGVRQWLTAGAASNHWVATLLFRGQDAEQVLGFSGRSELWPGIVRLIVARPLSGYGYQGARERVLDLMPWAAGAHNALAQSLLDVGLLGTVPVLLAIVVALVRTGRVAMTRAADGRAEAALGFALVTFLLLNGVSFESFAGTPGFEALALFATVVAGSRLGERRARARSRVTHALPARPRGAPALLGDSAS